MSGEVRSFEAVSAALLARRLQEAPDSPSRARAHKLHNRWRSFWEPRVDHAAPAGSSIYTPVNDALNTLISSPNACLGSGYSGNWSCIGPFNNYYGQTWDNSGRMGCIWVSPTNMNYMLAGASHGGLWKTTNGGQDWTNITDVIVPTSGSPVIPGTLGIHEIAVHPQNQNTIYIATGTHESPEYWDGAYGLGLIYSINGGQSWNVDVNFRNVTGSWQTNGWTAKNIMKLAYSPATSKLYVVYDRKVYMKATPTSNWQNITPPAISSLSSIYDIEDFEFTLNSTGYIVFTTTGVSNTQYLFTYDEFYSPTYDPMAWTMNSLHFNPVTCRTVKRVEDMALTADSAYLNVSSEYADLPSNDNVRYHLHKVKLDMNHVNLNPRHTNLGAHSRWLAVSEKHQNLLYITNVRGSDPIVKKSTDNGVTFNFINGGHADGRSIQLYHGGGNNSTGAQDTIFFATDGGISRKLPADASLKSLTGNGLCVTLFTNITSSPANSGLAAAGAVDNGNFSYMKNRATPWIATYPWADGLYAAFANNGSNIAYTQSQNGIENQFVYNPVTNITSLGSDIANPPDEFAGMRWHRPIAFDEFNTARYGSHCIWKRQLGDPVSPGSSAWQYAFGSEPKISIPVVNDSTTRSLLDLYKQPVDFAVPEFDNRIGYIAYHHIMWDNDDYLDVMQGNFFRSKDLNTPNPTWQNKTPNLAYRPITDIEVDPRQPNRVWVSYGGVDSWFITTPAQDRTRRVLYSYDWGDTWHEMSKGLPAMPIIKLLYVDGSDDVMFAATDVGVYRWNKAAQQWECFSNNMPRCAVSDIEFNYCSGKLRVSTFGRGVWETDMLADMGTWHPGEMHTISFGTTWSSSKTLRGSVRVKAGNTLTISGSSTRIYVPRNARILVEPGAKLVVDGATLTNECGFLWQGIEVMGNIYQPSNDTWQGTLELKNGAVIEHAINGFRNFANDNGMQGGGIIRAKNATFKNCKRAVELVNAPNYTYWNSTANASNCSFDGVTFLRDNAAIPFDQEAYFTSWLTKGGVVIKNSTFVNMTPYAAQPQHQRGTALSVYSTGMTVQGCAFQGFRRGLASGSINGDPAQSVTVHNNTFQFITENITMSAAAYGDIRGNNISMMYPSLSNKAPYGIYLDNTFGSYVGCTNKVDGSVVTVPSYGIIANNTSRYQTIVSRNTLSNCRFGMQTQNHNPSLTISCNTFNTNTYALSVNPGSPAGGNRLKDQGTGCATNQTRAGNKFSNTTYGIFSYLNNSWKYFAGNGTNEQPSWFGIMTFGACNTASSCGFTFECLQMVTPVEVQQGIDRYFQLKALGEQDGLEAQTIFGDVVRGFNTLDDAAGLTGFLEGESDDERIKKQLIPLYIGQARYEDAAMVVSELNVSDQERQGYVDYYTLIGTLKLEGRGINALTPDEFNMVKNLSNSDLEVTPYAKALLEAGHYMEWVHPIEDLPEESLARTVKFPVSEDHIESRLLNAAPNPADHTTTINVLVSKMDAAKKSFIIIRNVNGAEMYRSGALTHGENNLVVDTRNWATGLYLYSVVIDNKVMSTQKLVIAR